MKRRSRQLEHPTAHVDDLSDSRIWLRLVGSAAPIFVDNALHSIGSWHYKKGQEFKSGKNVVDLLCDIVSRNGNLMLNIPPPNSGKRRFDTTATIEWRPAWTRYSDRRSGRRGLSPPGIAHGPGYRIAGGLDVASGGGAPGAGIAIVLFDRKITEGGIEQVHGLVEAAFPAGAKIDGRMVVDVLAIFDGGALGFIDGAVNLFDRVALIAHHVVPIGPIEQGAGIAQIADGGQVARECTAIGGTYGRRRREHAADFIDRK